MVKFSIVTVSYNMADHIKKTIDSVLGQSFKDFQYVIVDGGSKDETVEIVKQYANAIDTFVSEPDGGIYDAMNKGVRLSEGDYVIFMNVGDTFASNRTLQDIAERMTGLNGLFYGDSIRESVDGVVSVYHEKTNKYQLTKKNICHQAIVYPRELLLEKGFELSFPILGDWARNIELYSKTMFHYIPIPICRYKLDGISSNDNRMKDPAFMDNLPHLIKENLGIFPFLYFEMRQIARFILMR